MASKKSKLRLTAQPTKKAARNFHACHPIMKKGGVHQKSRSAQRAATKRQTRHLTREWLGRSSLSVFTFVISIFRAS